MYRQGSRLRSIFDRTPRTPRPVPLHGATRVGRTAFVLPEIEEDTPSIVRRHTDVVTGGLRGALGRQTKRRGETHAHDIALLNGAWTAAGAAPASKPPS